MSHYSSVSFKDSHRTSVMSISCFFANTKNFSYPWSPYIFEYMMTANHTLFEKEGVFGFHVSTCHLEQLIAVAEDMFTLYSTDRSIAVHVHVAYVPCAIHVGRGFIITSLFGAYPLLGAYLLTTYTYKRIRLLTGVYGIGSSHQPMNTSEASVTVSYDSTAGGPQPLIFIRRVDTL